MEHETGVFDVVAAVSEVEAVMLPNVDTLEDNMARLDLTEPTREAIRAAALEGRIEERDGAEVLLVEGRALDRTPMDPRWTNIPSEEGVVVVFGIGVGNTVRALREQFDGAVAIYEPNPGIARTLLEQGPHGLGDVDLFTSLHELEQTWPRISGATSSATIVRVVGYPELYPKENAELHSMVEQLVARSSVNVSTYRQRARTWVSDLLDNIELLADAPPFMALAGKLEGVPAFIVGAGPSLAKNAHLLDEARRKGLVIAVNSSAPALSRRGIEPQVVACLESVDVSHLLRDLPFMSRVIRAYSLTAHPTTLRSGDGPLMPIFEALPELESALVKLTGQKGLPVCGSVSTAAFSLAQRLGCSPIVLVGQDLAYTGGHAYATGTAYEASRACISEDGKSLDLAWCATLRNTHDAGAAPMHDKEPLEWVTGWGGGEPVPSGLSFSPVRAWFGQAARVLARETPNLKLVNATEGGARIDGFQEVALAEILSGLPERGPSVEELVTRARAAARPLDAAAIADFLQEQVRATRRVRRAAEGLKKLARNALKHMDRDDAGRVARGFRKLEAAEAELRDSVRGAPLVDAWCFADVDAEMEVPDHSDDARAQARDGLLREARIATAVSRAATELVRRAEQIATRMKREPGPEKSRR